MAAPTPPAGVSLRLKSHPRYLRVVRAAIRSFGEIVGLDEARAHQVALAVDEGCANMIRHSYRGRPDGEIEVDVRIEETEGSGARLVIELRDEGDPVDPARLEHPMPLDPDTPGGLGLHLIHGACDSVRALPSGRGGNRIELSILVDPVRDE